VRLFANSHRQPNHPTPFITALEAGREGFVLLAEIQRRIATDHFGDDSAAFRDAFEDFGQGVLFDPRRRTGARIHMMDGTPTTWVGYHRWHAAIRAAMFFGADAAWLGQLCRNVAMAWGIQTEADPAVDREDNPGLPAARLRLLSDFWQGLDLTEIDDAFVRVDPAAPSPEVLRGPVVAGVAMAARAVAATRHQRVRQILDHASGDGVPGHGSFWNLPIAELLRLSVSDEQVIADPGPNRGARSALVKSLKGELPFGPDGDIPSMPRDRPPVSPENIAFIEQWIDDDCPTD
jgi:hypothetical protein